MSDKPANPPAFPFEELRNTSSDPLATPRRFQHGGMTLRDYFAVHADQPGVSEIVTMAGGETDGFHVKFSRDGKEYTFNEWWNDLPLDDRLKLSARVRYALADAMLAERSKP